MYTYTWLVCCIDENQSNIVLRPDTLIINVQKVKQYNKMIYIIYCYQYRGDIIAAVVNVCFIFCYLMGALFSNFDRPTTYKIWCL